MKLSKSIILLPLISLTCLSCSSNSVSFERFKTKVSHLRNSPYVRAVVNCKYYDIDGYCSFSKVLYRTKQYSYSGKQIDDGTKFSTVDKVIHDKYDKICVEFANINVRDFADEPLYRTYSTLPNLKIKEDNNKAFYIYEFNKFGDLTKHYYYVDGMITECFISYYKNYDNVGK